MNVASYIYIPQTTAVIGYLMAFGTMCTNFAELLGYVSSGVVKSFWDFPDGVAQDKLRGLVVSPDGFVGTQFGGTHTVASIDDFEYTDVTNNEVARNQGACACALCDACRGQLF